MFLFCALLLTQAPAPIDPMDPIDLWDRLEPAWVDAEVVAAIDELAVAEEEALGAAAASSRGRGFGVRLRFEQFAGGDGDPAWRASRDFSVTAWIDPWLLFGWTPMTTARAPRLERERASACAWLVGHPGQTPVGRRYRFEAMVALGCLEVGS